MSSRCLRRDSSNYPPSSGAVPIERYQADVDNRHFVFWLDFGGMEPDFVRRSMQLLAQEVVPHFKKNPD